MIRYLNEHDVRTTLGADALRAALRLGLLAISNGEAVAPPRVSAVGPFGLVGAMPGYVPSLGMAAKLVTVFPGNHAHGLPSHQGVVITFDPDTGEVTGLLDAAAITTIRTAHTAALAVDLLARGDSTSVAILGAGALGAEHHENWRGGPTLPLQSRNLPRQTVRRWARVSFRAGQTGTLREGSRRPSPSLADLPHGIAGLHQHRLPQGQQLHRHRR